MKKILKISTLALVIVIMCMSFCGCAELDDMKESHAVWTEKGNKDSITYNGKTYKLLENNELHDPQYNQNWDNTIYVTEPDVPVLLSTDFGIDLQLSADGSIISGYIFDDYKTEVQNPYGLPFYSEYGLSYVDGNGKMVYYCEESKFDEISKKIEAGINYTGYGYEYWTYNGEDEPYHYTYLSDEDAKMIDKIIETVKPDQHNEIPYEYMSICILDKVSDDKSFGMTSYEVYYYGDGNYCLGEWSEIGICTTYEVPEKYIKDFDRIFKYALETSEYWDPSEY